MAEVLNTSDGRPVSEDNPLPVKLQGGGGGADGKSLEFDWDGTELGVRVEGDEEYEYVDLRGPQGEPGKRGDPGEPGNDGEDAEPQFTEEQVAALLALIEDDE